MLSAFQFGCAPGTTRKSFLEALSIHLESNFHHVSFGCGHKNLLAHD